MGMHGHGRLDRSSDRQTESQLASQPARQRETDRLIPAGAAYKQPKSESHLNASKPKAHALNPQPQTLDLSLES